MGIEPSAPDIDLEDIKMQGVEVYQQIVEWSQSPKFYTQSGIIVGAMMSLLIWIQ